MNPRFATTVLLAACVAACASVPPPRSIDPVVARSHAASDFDSGVAAYGRGEFAVALEYFTRAYDTEPSRAVLFDIARTHEALEHDALAARFYVRYLQSSDPLDPQSVHDATAALERLRARVGWILVRAARPLLVDGMPVEPSPEPIAVAVLPGVRTVSRTPEGELAVRIRAGEVLSVDFAALDAPLVFAQAGADDLRLATAPRPSIP